MSTFRVYGGSASDLGNVRQLPHQTFSDFVQHRLRHATRLKVTRGQYAAMEKKQRQFAKRVSYVTPACFTSSPAQRLHQNADTFCLVALDIDDSQQALPFATDPTMLHQQLAGLQFAAYTTASSTLEAPRLRILAAADNLPIRHYSAAVHTLAQMLGLPTVTKESQIVVQPMFLPTIFKDDNAAESHPLIASGIEGDPLTLDVLSDGDPSYPTALYPQGSINADGDDLDYLRPTLEEFGIEDMRSVLEFLDPDMTYPEWLEVAMGLRHQFPHEPESTQAYELFDEWSSKGTKYVDPDDTMAKWRSVAVNPKGKVPVTCRTIIKKALANGWIKSTARDRASGKVDVMVPSGDVQIRDTAIKLVEVFASLDELFVRSSTIVELVVGIDGPELAQIGADEFLTRIERRCRLLAWRVGKDGKAVLKPTKLPVADARAILVSRELRDGLPKIELISNSPLITSTGEILGPGYHRQLGGVLVTGKLMPELVTEDAAVDGLFGLLEDFRFATDGDGSRALASIITPALRMSGLIMGHVPVDVAEADHSQSGKTYRQMGVRAIYNETAYPITKKTGGVGSLDESLAAGLFSGKPFISFDNYRGKLDSPSLESALTWGEPIRVRIPYHGEVAVDIKRVNFQITSNGFDATKDLANRVSIVRILKQPEGYSFKSYPEGDLLRHIKARQPFYLGCVFTVIRMWLVAGRPRTNEARHDFREWAQTLDWIVKNVFSAAPLMEGHRAAQQRVSDPALTWLRQVAVEATSAPDTCGQELRPKGIYDLCVKAGIETPGAQPTQEPWRMIGAILEKLFRDKPAGEAIAVDQYQVQHACRTDPFDGYRERHFYSFNFAGSPETP